MDIEALERKEIKKKQKLVALLFVLALVLAMVFAYWMGAFGLGVSKYFYVDYSFAGGIERGSTVRLAGIKVGRVSEIDFVNSNTQSAADSAPEGMKEPASLRLKIEVNRAAFKQVSSDSKFFINLAGLIGERYVEIVPGSGASVEGGHMFRGVDPPRIDQLFSQGYGIFADLRAFFQENRGDLKEMFNALNGLSKNLQEILKSVSPQQKKQISTLLANFSEASEDAKQLFQNLNSATSFAEKNGAKETWTTLNRLLDKANGISKSDLRRLMLEDGVRVRFGKNEVPKEEASH